SSHSLGRVLIDEFDSESQAELFSSLGAVDAVQRLTTYLRVGSLLADRVVVTDAMLLDGAFFIALGPAGVAAVLGRGPGPLPLVVTSPHPTLERALLDRRRNRRFTWAMDRTSVGRGRADRRGRWPDAVEAGWAAWLAAQSQGLIAFETQSTARSSLRHDPLPPLSPAATALGRRLRLEPRRSGAWRRIDASGLSLAERDALRTWWGKGYSQFLAARADADWISFNGGTSGPADSVRVALPTALLTWAQEVGPASFSQGWDAAASQRARLRRRPGWASMRDLAFIATSGTRPATRRRVLFGAAGTSLLAVAAIVLGVPSWEASEIAEPVTWAAFAVVAMTTFPWAAVRSLIRLIGGERRAALIVLPRS
ncbi:hypothetical protein, partial [uncultured Microbacterium sp.]|uniref:hypothetical protein n=1 Tax=uncultured Microbacterium sp. TaxID=191216 RepID=UPI0025FAB31A